MVCVAIYSMNRYWTTSQARQKSGPENDPFLVVLGKPEIDIRWILVLVLGSPLMRTDRAGVSEI